MVMWYPGRRLEYIGGETLEKTVRSSAEVIRRGPPAEIETHLLLKRYAI